MPDNKTTFKLPNLLLIAGQQQNVGKTTLACKIISHFSRTNKIIAFKVSPHFHNDVGDASVVQTGDKWQILEETSAETDKDTSRMLQAGADKAYLLQADAEGLYDGFKALVNLVPKDYLIVCESAGIHEFVSPGVFLVLRQLYCKICSIDDEKLFQKADRIVTYTVNGFDFFLDELDTEKYAWQLKKS